MGECLGRHAPLTPSMFAFRCHGRFPRLEPPGGAQAIWAFSDPTRWSELLLRSGSNDICSMLCRRLLPGADQSSLPVVNFRRRWTLRRLLRGRGARSRLFIAFCSPSAFYPLRQSPPSIRIEPRKRGFALQRLQQGMQRVARVPRTPRCVRPSNAVCSREEGRQRAARLRADFGEHG